MSNTNFGASAAAAAAVAAAARASVAAFAADRAAAAAAAAAANRAAVAAATTAATAAAAAARNLGDVSNSITWAIDNRQLKVPNVITTSTTTTPQATSTSTTSTTTASGTTTTTTNQFAWPTEAPTQTPSPTYTPTMAVLIPTSAPTGSPSSSPSGSPSSAPVPAPSQSPTASPTQNAATSTTTSTTSTTKGSTATTSTTFLATTTTTTTGATFIPTDAPTKDPTKSPTYSPTILTVGPSLAPTASPSGSPSSSPSSSPTVAPTSNITFGNITKSTFTPTPSPTGQPTDQPTTTTVNTTLGAVVNGTNATVNFSLPTSAPSSLPTMVVTSDTTAKPTGTPTSKSPDFVELITTNVSKSTNLTNSTNSTVYAQNATNTSVTTFTPITSPTSTPTASPSSQAPTSAPSLSPSVFIAVNTTTPNGQPTPKNSPAPTYFLEAFPPSSAPTGTPAVSPIWTPTAVGASFSPTISPSGSSVRSTNTPTVEITLSPVSPTAQPTPSSASSAGPTSSPTQLILSFSPTPAPTSLALPPPTSSATASTNSTNSTTAVILANTTNVANVSNVTLKPYSSSLASLDIQIVSPDRSASSEVSWGLAGGALGVSALGAAVSVLLHLRNFGGAYNARLEAYGRDAEEGRLNVAGFGTVRGEARLIWNRLAYYTANPSDAQPLNQLLNAIVRANTNALATQGTQTAAQTAADAVAQAAQAVTYGRQQAALEAIRQEIQNVATVAQQGQQILEARLAGISEGIAPLPGLISELVEISHATASQQQPSSVIALPIQLSPPASTVSLHWSAVPSGPAPELLERRLQAVMSALPPKSFIPLTSISIQTQDKRIVDLWGYLIKAEQLTYLDPAKISALNLAQAKVLQLISEGNIQPTDWDTLQTVLIPNLTNEINGAELWFASMDSATRLAGTQSLSVEKLSSNRYVWDVNFLPNGGPTSYTSSYDKKVRFFLMDPNKPSYTNNQQKTSEANLDAYHSQYLGSDTNEIITVDVTSAATYNVVAMGGDDIIRVLSDGVSNSVVNIYGGTGKNTYVIAIQGTWSKLPGTIHIWDFDPTKDSIVFMSADGSRTADPRIKETKRTLFSSTADNLYSVVDGQPEFRQNTASNSYAYTTNMFRQSSNFKAAEHEYTGDGIPLLVIDEKNYDTNNPDSLFNNPNVFRTDQSIEIADSVQGNTAPLFVSTTLNTQFSQLERNGDHDFFSVHLKQGQSYVFKMEHRPDMAGDGVLTTALRLTDNLGNDISTGFSRPAFLRLGDGNSRIDFFAANEGDYFLDASGTGTTATGKYAISAIEVSHQSINAVSVTNGTTNTPSAHVGYKMALTAGDYMQLSFAIRSDLNITINNAFNEPTPTYPTTGSRDGYAQTFLVNKTGDYFIDAETRYSKGVDFVLTSAKIDVEGSKDTKALLMQDTSIPNKIDFKGDHDWYQIGLQAGKNYQFDMQKASTSPNLDTYLRLRDANGNEVASNDDISRFDFNSRIVYKPTTTGVFYLDAALYQADWGEPSTTTGDYNLSYKVI